MHTHDKAGHDEYMNDNEDEYYEDDDEEEEGASDWNLSKNKINKLKKLNIY
jgi:hypothetical protein